MFHSDWLASFGICLEQLHGVHRHEAIGPGVADYDYSWLRWGESEGAERNKMVVQLRRDLFIDRGVRHAVGMLDGHGHLARAIGAGSVGKADFVTTTLRHFDFKPRQFCPFGFVAIVMTLGLWSAA